MLGPKVYVLHIACPTQAGVTALISPSARNMQDKLLMCEKYNSKWRFTFSSPKCQILHFSTERDAGVSLYNKQLPKTTSIKHVGIKLQANCDHLTRTAETCKLIKSTSMALLQSGCHPHGFSPLTSLKLVKTLCLAKSLYGCELWNTLSQNELLAFERAFRCSRFAQTNSDKYLPRTNRYHFYRINNRHAQVVFPGSSPTNSYLDISIQSRLLCLKNKCVQTGLCANTNC